MKRIKVFSTYLNQYIRINPDNIDYYHAKKTVPDKSEPPQIVGTMVFFSGSEKPQQLKEVPEVLDRMIDEVNEAEDTRRIKAMYSELQKVIKELIPVWK